MGLQNVHPFVVFFVVFSVRVHGLLEHPVVTTVIPHSLHPTCMHILDDCIVNQSHAVGQANVGRNHSYLAFLINA